MARNKEFNEEEVLAKAMQLFWQRGYSNTSMQDLVQGLGISRSSLYDTYGDKHALFVKALEYYRAGASQRMIDLIDQASSAREAIKQLLQLTITDLLHDVQHKGCFIVNATVEVATHDAQIKELVCHNDTNIEEAFYQAIRKGQHNGDITTRHNARAMARFMITTIKGMRVSAKLANTPSFYEDVMRVTLSVLD